MSKNQSIPLDAFNLQPGAVIEMPNGDMWCVTSVMRDSNTEEVGFRARRVDNVSDPVRHQSFVYDYMETVNLIGLIVNPYEDDDSNYGQTTD